MHFLPVKRLSLIVLLLVGLGSAGCANMTATERRVSTGAGVGAVTGAVITGRPGGAAAGALLGAGVGWLYDRDKKKRYYYDRYGRRHYER